MPEVFTGFDPLVVFLFCFAFILLSHSHLSLLSYLTSESRNETVIYYETIPATMALSRSAGLVENCVWERAYAVCSDWAGFSGFNCYNFSF